MGLFDSLRAKRYWREHEDERKNIENEGAVLLAEFNDLVHRMNVTPDVDGYAEIRERLFYILDWFIDIENKKCPYHLIGGGENKRKEIARVYNNGLRYAVKRNSEDFEKTLELLIEDSENYTDCKIAIEHQKKTDNNYFKGTGGRFVSILQNHFEQNSFLKEPLIACGIPKDIVLSRDKDKIETYKPSFSQQEKDDFNAYFLSLKNRYRLAHEPLSDMTALATTFNINILDGEIIYQRINSVTLHEEVVVSRNVSYGGIKYSFGLVRGGNLNYTTNAIKNFRLQDYGGLFITNKRILFVGKQRNKTVSVNLTSVATYELFQDGVMLRIVNRNNGIMFRFEPTQRVEGMLLLQDGLNNFTSILDRIFGNTEDKEV